MQRVIRIYIRYVGRFIETVAVEAEVVTEEQSLPSNQLPFSPAIDAISLANNTLSDTIIQDTLLKRAREMQACLDNELVEFSELIRFDMELAIVCLLIALSLSGQLSAETNLTEEDVERIDSVLNSLITSGLEIESIWDIIRDLIPRLFGQKSLPQSLSGLLEDLNTTLTTTQA